MTQIWNNEIVSKKSFPKNLKLADLTPVIKKIDSTLAGNYRSVTVLPNISKVFGFLKNSYKSNLIIISTYSYHHFLCGYRKRVQYSIYIDGFNGKNKDLS